MVVAADSIADDLREKELALGFTTFLIRPNFRVNYR